MDYKKSYTVYHIGFIVGLALCLIALIVKTMWLVIPGAVIGFLAMFQTALFYRCPKCGALLTSKSKIPARCPSCGYKLESK